MATEDPFGFPDSHHQDVSEQKQPYLQVIFTFGSNLAGRHGKGSAKEALEKYGAIYGQGIGLQGNSYAIPTKDRNLQILPLVEIERFVHEFLIHAWTNPQNRYRVVAIGCGLAGYKPEEIAPMFKNYPDNVDLPKEFREVINGSR